MRHSTQILACLLLSPALALAQGGGFPDSPNSSLTADLLPVGRAFQPRATLAGEQIEIDWQIAPGYYLYRQQFQVATDSRVIESVDLQAGETTYDPFFDEQLEIYRDQTSMRFPAPADDTLFVRFQGCADAGYCYPPSWMAFHLDTGEQSIEPLGLVAGPGAQPETRIWTPVLATLILFLAVLAGGWILRRP